MREKLATFTLLLFIALPSSGLRADDVTTTDTATTASAPSKKRIALEVRSTLSFTVCVAKLLTNGLGAQEARQLCLDSN